MKTRVNLLAFITAAIVFIVSAATFGQSSDKESLFQQTFDLTGERSHETQFYILESTLKTYSEDGTEKGTNIFNLYLKSEPSSESGDEYSCIKFSVKEGENEVVEIPALAGWKYVFKNGIDENNYVFGIDHVKFDNLTDKNGNPVSPEISYHVYNAFIDFHSFCNVFADKTEEGGGIQNLTRIGQKILHDAAFTEPPVNLGSNVAEGSFFKNGEITLELKGLSYVNDKACGIIHFDSGESSFKMIMKPMPNMEITTLGRSHYYGDFYKDLKSNWIQKVTLMETVISQTKMPEPYGNVNSVIERSILILNVDKSEVTN